jgi:uncharacterized protein YlxW (UPF0749 family)
MRENDLKRRIKMISNYGKISIGSIFTGIVIIMIVAAVGLTDKIGKADISNNTQSSINAVSVKSLSIILTDNEEGLKDNTRVDSYYPNLYPYLVHFQDIKDITGELKNLGAVNISVNGESITESSDISTEGQFIKINGSRYKPPFTVKAEWNKDISSDSLLKDSSIISNLKSRGLVVKIYEP